MFARGSVAYRLAATVSKTRQDDPRGGTSRKDEEEMPARSTPRRAALVTLPLILGALIFAPTAVAGSFTIGDRDAAIGTSVTFWGAQWWKLNSLSGGEAPSSFKGWVNSFPTPACGLAWTSGTGNSSEPPPAPLPEYVDVAVASKISQEGSVETSATTPKVVLVRTNPAYERKSGYQNDPGHEGVGTVVAVVCEPEGEIR
jgi:hypothetical protein